MTNSTPALLQGLKENKIQFTEVIAHIEHLYHYTPTSFKNGEVLNEANQNQGSAKVFYFAQLNQLSKEDTLLLFAEHYQAVLQTPENTDHQNIRQFMQYRREKLAFENEALRIK